MRCGVAAQCSKTERVLAATQAASRRRSAATVPTTLAVVALSALLFCSCRAPATPSAIPATPAGWTPGSSETLPPEAFTGAPQVPVGPPGMEQGIPLPYAVAGPWAPPGLAQPWPKDEYLADGGDHPPAACTLPDQEVRGLNFEDTVAHFQTLDGRTLTEPSNRVYVYSPRFRAVRQVVNVQQDAQAENLNDMHLPTRLADNQRAIGPDTNTQNLQATRQASQAGPIIYWMRQGDGAVSSAIGPNGFQGGFQPYEDFTAIRLGVMLEAEMPFLADGVTAALTWSSRQAVQVMIDNQAAAAETGVDKISMLYSVNEKITHPKLRLIKVASTQFAQPGETVDFTLRFDNVGSEIITDVTILDNLTTRLEYVAESTQSSVPAQFSARPNEAGSQVLQWVITKPLKVGEGGVIRFQCRVR